METFIEGQRCNIEQVKRMPIFRDLIGSLDRAYRSAIGAVPRLGVALIFGRILLICHKSMLSAATLIGQGQPEDSTGVTRRAVEAARVALAIRLNDENAAQWTAYQGRHDRWLRRQQNERPKPFRVEFRDIRGHPLIERLDTHLGILSDASVHFTPEFYSSLDWEVNRTEDGQGEVYLNYFQRNPREIELQYIFLGAAHLTILEALDSCCDGKFQLDTCCREPFAEFVRIGRTFNEAHHREYGASGE
jgi:hypothetical protein